MEVTLLHFSSSSRSLPYSPLISRSPQGVWYALLIGFPLYKRVPSQLYYPSTPSPSSVGFFPFIIKPVALFFPSLGFVSSMVHLMALPRVLWSFYCTSSCILFQHLFSSEAWNLLEFPLYAYLGCMHPLVFSPEDQAFFLAQSSTIVLHTTIVSSVLPQRILKCTSFCYQQNTFGSP